MSCWGQCVHICVTSLTNLPTVTSPGSTLSCRSNRKHGSIVRRRAGQWAQGACLSPFLSRPHVLAVQPPLLSVSHEIVSLSLSLMTYSIRFGLRICLFDSRRQKPSLAHRLDCRTCCELCRCCRQSGRSYFQSIAVLYNHYHAAVTPCCG